MDITYIYDWQINNVRVTSRVLQDLIERAVRKINDELYNKSFPLRFAIEDIRPFTEYTGKPLANYNTAQLSKFLKKDAHFRNISKNTDNIQVKVYGMDGWFGKLPQIFDKTLLQCTLLLFARSSSLDLRQCVN